MRRTLGLGRSVGRVFRCLRPTALVRNPASLSDERPHVHSPSCRLCARRERPGSSRATEERDELAPFHVWMAPAWQEKM